MENVNNKTFEKLFQVDFGDAVEEKMGLTYAPWALVWYELKRNCPDAKVKVYETEENLNYFTDGQSAFVKVSVTINGEEIIEHLPVMDNRNASIMLDKLTSRNVTDTIQRCFVKACARHGLGLYVYLGWSSPTEHTTNTPAKITRKRKIEKPENAKNRSTTRPENPYITPREPRRNENAI